MVKTLRILVLVALAAAVASCRTTVPGPIYQLRVETQSSTPVPLSNVGTLQILFDTANPAMHFDTVPDMTFDGGVSSHIEGSGVGTGDYIVEYPGDYVRAFATPKSDGFTIILNFYPSDTMPDQHIGHMPIVRARVLDPGRNEIANGASRPIWPLPTSSPPLPPPLLLAIQCDAMAPVVCNP